MAFKRLKKRAVLEVRDELVSRVYSAYMEPLERDMISAMLASITVLIEKLLFLKLPTSINYFRELSNRLDRERIFILFRLLARYFVAFFMVNKDTKKLLSFGNIPEEHMRNVVFKVFGYEECEETVFLQIDQMIGKEKYGESWSLMYQYIFERAFGVEKDEVANILAENLFVGFFSVRYTVFLELLSKIMDQRIDVGTELKKQLEGFEEK